MVGIILGTFVYIVWVQKAKKKNLLIESVICGGIMLVLVVLVNVIYELVEEYYHYQEKRWVPFKIEKVEGNYEGEKILDIYNDRIIRTDKGFYEIVKYYDKDGNVKTTTLKMELPSKYYDEVLTFTYEYVILNDYTLVPINDIVTKRGKEYKYNYYVDKFEETLEEFVE